MLHGNTPDIFMVEFIMISVPHQGLPVAVPGQLGAKDDGEGHAGTQGLEAWLALNSGDFYRFLLWDFTNQLRFNRASTVIFLEKITTVQGFCGINQLNFEW